MRLALLTAFTCPQPPLLTLLYRRQRLARGSHMLEAGDIDRQSVAGLEKPLWPSRRLGALLIHQLDFSVKDVEVNDMAAVNQKFVSYLRVSTDRQKASGLGLEAQRKAVLDYLNGGRWTLGCVDEFDQA